MPKICEGCEENSAVVECLDCGAFWCTECDATTHRLKKFQSHRRIPLASGSPPPLTAAEPEDIPKDELLAGPPLSLSWAAASVNCEATGREVRKVGGRNFCFDGHAWANERVPAGVVSWYALRVKATMMGAVMVGVAPAQRVSSNVERLYQEVGWYFYGADFKAYSGPPNRASGKDVISGTSAASSAVYRSGCLRKGDEISVVIDAREAAATMHVAVNKGVLVKVFEGIPLEEPLVPVVEFFGKSDVVEIIS